MKSIILLLCVLSASLVVAAPDGTLFKQILSEKSQPELSLLKQTDARPYESGFDFKDNVFVCDNGQDVKARRGVSWNINLNQKKAVPFAVTAWARTVVAGGTSGPDYSLYIDLKYMDGTPLWGQCSPFDPDPDAGWHKRQVIITPDKPVRFVSVYLLFRGRNGKAVFRDPRFGVLDDMDVQRFDGQFMEQVRHPEEGFLIRDVAADSGFVSIEREALGVKISVDKTVGERVTFYDVSMEDTSGKDRALTLLYTIPLKKGSLTWFHDPRHDMPLDHSRNGVMNAGRQDLGSNGLLSRYPFGAVSAGGENTAIGLDPSTPLFFRTGCHAGTRELYLACDIGLTREKPGAYFKMCVFSFDAAEGFRGALDSYYRLYPEAFETRIKKQGLWMPFASISKVEGWQDFGFRIKEGTDETAWDDAHDILTFRYTEPMTWWMRMENVKSLDEAVTHANQLADKGDKAAQVWRSSAFEDEKGKIPGSVRDTPWCNGVVWSINSAPGVAGEVTDFRKKWNADYIEKQYGPSRKADCDGEYVDSVEGYVTSVLDFRRDHFASMERPLCYSLHTHKPGIFKGMIAFEYVRAIAKDMHERGKFMMANGAPHNWFWIAPMLDVCGTETNWNRDGGWTPMSVEELLYRRAMCRGKPYCFLMNSDFSKFSRECTEKYMKRCLAFGMFPGFFSADASTGHYFSRPELYNRDRLLFKKYVPLCKLVAEAGWEPLTGVISTDQAVIVERFDKPGVCYLTVYNDSDKPHETGIKLTSLEYDGACRELVEGRDVRFESRQITMNLPPGDVRVLELR